MGDISSGYLQDFLTGTKIVQEQEKALLEGFKISDNELMMGEGENKIGKFSINLPFAVVDTVDSNVGEKNGESFMVLKMKAREVSFNKAISMEKKKYSSNDAVV